MKLAGVKRLGSSMLRSIWFFGVFLLACLAWLPKALTLRHPLGDQVAEKIYDLTLSCQSGFFLGWTPEVPLSSPTASPALFVPLLSGQFLKLIVCQIAIYYHVSPLVVYLLLGQLLAYSLTFLALRWANFTFFSCVLGGFLMVTAPSSFSRIGHLTLAFLAPVVPTIVASSKLIDSCSCRGEPQSLCKVWIFGIIAALLCLPLHEYYLVFSVLILFASFLLAVIVSTSAGIELFGLAYSLKRGLLFLTGYMSVVIILALPKLAVAGAQPFPVQWSTPRYVSEQFQYGLLPFTWFVASPWVDSVRNTLQSAGLSTSTESYFWSVGSLLIPLAWINALRRCFQRSGSSGYAELSAGRESGLSGMDVGPRRQNFVILLFLISAIGLLCMTMGGLGTLFAAYISPVMRSLNRFTVYVYGASVVYLLSEVEIWMKRGEGKI